MSNETSKDLGNDDLVANVDIAAVYDRELYPALDEAEWWLVAGNGPLVLRFGPFTGPEAGEKLSRAVQEGIAVTLVAQCDRAIDWNSLRALQGLAAEPEHD